MPEPPPVMRMVLPVNFMTPAPLGLHALILIAYIPLERRHPKNSYLPKRERLHVQPAVRQFHDPPCPPHRGASSARRLRSQGGSLGQRADRPGRRQVDDDHPRSVVGT